MADVSDEVTVTGSVSETRRERHGRDIDQNRSTTASREMEPPRSELSRLDDLTAAERRVYMKRAIWALRYR
jgi:hypothetical protein